MAKTKQQRTLRRIDQARTGIRLPRPKTNIQYMTGQGTSVQSRTIAPIGSTGATTQFDTFIRVNPASNNVANDAGGTVLRNYQLYKMNSLRATWTPAVGTTTAGTVYLAYFDNPEIMFRWGSYSYADKLALVKQNPTCVKAPVWMALELAGSLMTRRPRYSVDATIPTTVVDFDMTTHGMFAFVTEGCPFNTPVGVVALDYSATGYHLQNVANSGI